MKTNIKILCVDDEPNVLNALRRLFLDEDYTVITAASAQEGLDILRNEHIQIVISDYRMPNMNGVEFLKEVFTRWPDTVRIVLSGYADTASIVSAINEGQVYKFIPKPWNDDDLKVNVVNAIERYYLFKENAELTSQLVRINEDLKKLLDENASLLELKSEMLEASQTMLYSLPVAVLGISDNIIVQCNEAWATETGSGWGPLGKDADNVLPPQVMEFLEMVRAGGKNRKKITINGKEGCLFGSIVRGGDNKERGIILVFVHGDCA